MKIEAKRVLTPSTFADIEMGTVFRTSSATTPVTAMKVPGLSGEEAVIILDGLGQHPEFEDWGNFRSKSVFAFPQPLIARPVGRWWLSAADRPKSGRADGWR